MHEWDDLRLGAAMADLGPRLVVGDPGLVEVVRARIDEPHVGRTHRPSPGLVAAATILLVTIGVVLASPGVRSAAAKLLGIGGTEIEVVDDPPVGAPTTAPSNEAGQFTEGADGIIATAETMGIELRTPSKDLAGPILGWTTRPQEDPTDLIVVFDAVSITYRRIDEDSVLRRKVVGLDQEVRFDRLSDGTEVLWVEGPHAVLTETVPEAAGNVLLWADGDTEYRLADAPDLAVAMSIAESMVNPG